MPKKEVLEKKCEKARVALDLTPEQVKLIQREAHALYEEISYDLLPDSKRHRTCKRATVLEVVLDAGRLEEGVRERLLRDESYKKILEKDPTYKPPILRAFDDYDRMQDLVGPAFLYDEYEAGPYQDEQESASGW
jgi:hypothetical protein